MNTTEFKLMSTYFQNRVPKNICLSEIDSNEINNSRFYLMMNSNSSDKVIFEFSLTDMDHQYYKSKVLLAVLMINLMVRI